MSTIIDHPGNFGGDAPEFTRVGYGGAARAGALAQRWLQKEQEQLLLEEIAKEGR